jgi:TP901 family phage tail tape measure protein
VADDIIAILDFDGSPAMATIDEIIAALEQLSEAASQVGDAAGGMTSLDDILSAIQANTDATAAGFAQLDDSLSTIASIADEAAMALQSVDATLAEMGSGGVEEATAGLEALDAEMRTKAEDANGMMDALNAAQGPMMMIAGAAIMAGGAFVKMGSDGQAGEALLKGMAGASQSDINALEADAEKLGVGMKEASSGFYMVESAGYSGSKAILVFDAAMKLTEGGQAQASDVMTGLTAIMHDYNLGADQATSTTDKMAETVLKGKQSMQDFATSIGPLAAAGHKAGIGLNDVLSAEATMTQINPHVRQDTMQLAALFDSLDPKMGKVEATAKGLGLSFNDAHYKSLDLLGKLQYLAQISGGTTTPAFAKLTGGVRGATAATDIMIGKGKTFQDNMHAMAHSTGATENAFKQYESTVPGAMGHVSASLSIFATKLMDALGPKVVPIINKVADAIGHMADFLTSHMDVLIPILAGLAAVIGGAVVVALIALIAAAGPVIAIILGIGIVVGGIVFVFMHWGQIAHWLQGVWASVLGWLRGAWSSFSGWIMGILHSIASFFTNIWNGIVHGVQAAWNAITSGIRNAINTIVNVVKIGGLLLLAAFFAPIIAIVALFLWLYNHNYYFKALIDTIVNVVKAGLAWLQSAWTNVVNFLVGLWNQIRATATAVWQAIVMIIQTDIEFAKSILESVWNAVISWLQARWNDLVNIASSAWNSIKSGVQSAWNGIVNLIHSAWNGIVAFASGWPAQALQWGINLIQGFINGITSMIPNVAGAVSGVISKVAGILGFHSPAKEGPGHDADQWAPALMRMFAEGLKAGVPQVQTAALQAAGALKQSLQQHLLGGVSVNANLSSIGGGSILSITGSGSVAPLGSNNAAIPLLQMMVSLIQQQQGKPQGPMTPPVTTMFNNMSLYGIQNIQDLYNQLSSLQGYAFESGSRGAL